MCIVLINFRKMLSCHHFTFSKFWFVLSDLAASRSRARDLAVDPSLPWRSARLRARSAKTAARRNATEIASSTTAPSECQSRDRVPSRGRDLGQGHGRGRDQPNQSRMEMREWSLIGSSLTRKRAWWSNNCGGSVLLVAFVVKTIRSFFIRLTL